MNLPFKYLFAGLLLTGLFVTISSCSKAEKEEFLIFNGEFSQESVLGLKGFNETLTEVLREMQIPDSQFATLKTKCIDWKQQSQSGNLSEQEVADFVNILLTTRKKLFEPAKNKEYYPGLEESAPVFQKTIPLSEMDFYLNNRFRDIQGKVEYAGDLIETNMENTTLALMYALSMGYLYPQSPLSDMVDGGYAVIRFRTIGTPNFAFADKFLKLAGNKLNIQEIMSQGKGLSSGYEGGINGCGLNDLETPEYFFQFTVLVKGEIYEITPRGRGILRTVLSENGWEASEGQVTTKSSVSAEAFDTAPFNTSICNGLTSFIDGHTFPTHITSNGLTLVLSKNSSLTQELGFTQTQSERFALSIGNETLHKVDSFGLYFTMAKIKDDTFRLRGVTSTGYGMITTTDPETAHRTNMVSTDIGTYRKTVSMKEIDKLIRIGANINLN